MDIEISLVRRVSDWQFALRSATIDSSRIIYFANEQFRNRAPDDTDGTCRLGYESPDDSGLVELTVECRDMLPKMRESGLHYVTLPYTFFKGTENENGGHIHIVTHKISGVRYPDAEQTRNKPKNTIGRFKECMKYLLSSQAQVDLEDKGAFVLVDCSPFRADLTIKWAQKSQPKH